MPVSFASSANENSLSWASHSPSVGSAFTSHRLSIALLRIQYLALSRANRITGDHESFPEARKLCSGISFIGIGAFWPLNTAAQSTNTKGESLSNYPAVSPPLDNGSRERSGSAQLPQYPDCSTQALYYSASDVLLTADLSSQ